MWELYRLAKTWRTRPSELIAVEDELAKFCLDRAVATFGLALENELNSVHFKDDKDGKKAERKRAQILRKWLPETMKASTGTGFRDPGGSGIDG